MMYGWEMNHNIEMYIQHAIIKNYYLPEESHLKVYPNERRESKSCSILSLPMKIVSASLPDLQIPFLHFKWWSKEVVVFMDIDYYDE